MKCKLLKDIYALKANDIVDVVVEGNFIKMIKDGLYWTYPNDEQLIRIILEPISEINNSNITVKTKNEHELSMDTQDQKLTIYVKKGEDGRLAIETEDRDNEFVFLGSKPEIVKAIGELLIKASQI